LGGGGGGIFLGFFSFGPQNVPQNVPQIVPNKTLDF
jgi:hypothetical protein